MSLLSSSLGWAMLKIFLKLSLHRKLMEHRISTWQDVVAEQLNLFVID
jgi:hypothetical protein